jgi:hypothetical protein
MMSSITEMGVLMDFDAMCTAIAKAGRDAMNLVGEPDAGNLPTQFERALRELMGLRADGIRWKHYSKQDLETRCKAHRVRRIAEREIGRLLLAMVEAGLRTAGRATEGHKAGAPTGLPTLDDLGIDRVDSQKWQKLARLSDEEFEAMLTGEIARLTTPRRRSSSAGPKIHMIDLTSVAIPSRRLRRLQREKVAALAESMRDQGLINPITLRPGEEGRYPLIAGHHRYLAARKLEWEKIPAIIRKGLDAVDAELCEIDENYPR